MNERPEAIGDRDKADDRPLAGIRVLDLSRVLSGPFCTMHLADLGAEIIKIEDVAGSDVTRHNPPFVGGESHYFLSCNRNKMSVALDLKSPQGRAMAKELALSSDVVVHNFRNGVMDRLGLDHATLSAEAPHLVSCGLSGFGATGPLRDKIAYDLIIQALTGAMAVTGEQGRPPVRMGLPLADEVAGVFAAIGILAALERRDDTGRGSDLDISMFDVGVSMLSYMANIYFATGSSPERLGSAHPTIYPYNGFQTADSWIVVAPFTQVFWSNFCTAIGRAELVEDARFRSFSQRLANRAELASIIEPILASRTTQEWLATLDAGDVPNGPINTIGQAIEMEQTKARGMVREVEHPTAGRIRILGSPFQFLFSDGSRFRPAFQAAPLLGEDTAEVLTKRLGVPVATVEEMLSAGLARTSEGRRGSRLRAAPAAARPTAARPVVAASPDEDRRPLAGLRVLDLTRMLAGPTTGLLLADMGAEVIKIEEPQIGDPTRRNVPHLGGESTYYMAVNRGKLGITLDLKSPEGRAALLDLVAKSDIIVENFRAGVMDRLGLGFDVLREVRKDIVLCSISGFGASGPLRDKTSFDLVNQAMAGTMSVTGEVGRPPARIGVPAGDLCGGYFGCLAILAALRARRKTGRGAHIDLSLHDCLISLLGYLGQAYFTTGESLGPVGSGHHHIVPYGAFDASDGTLVIAAFSQNFWERFAGAIGRPDLLSDARFETLERRKTNREPLMAILRPILSSGTRDYWIATLGEHDVPCATIASVGEALESDQAVARGLVFEVAHSSLGALKALATPLRADGAPWLSALPPPMLGEHTRQVLAGLLGYSEEDIARHLSIQKRPKVGRGADASLATGRTS